MPVRYDGSTVTVYEKTSKLTLIAVRLRNATPAVFHQRHIGRLLRSSCRGRGRSDASVLGREPGAGRCPPLWPGHLRNDGGGVAVDGRAAGLDGRLDGTLRPDDRRGKEVRRVEHPGPGRLERGARGRREAPAGVGGAGTDR